MPDLTPEQGQALARVRRAIACLVAEWPDQAARPRRACCWPARPSHSARPALDLVDLINQRWQATPFEIVRRRAN